ncbi:hypothetical protein JNK13_05735 [bacterium]|nr:hypothetical protein [bacterium]
MRHVVSYLLLFFLCLTSADAQEIALKFSTELNANKIVVKIGQAGKGVANGIEPRVEFLGREYQFPVVSGLRPGRQRTLSIDTELPERQGTYPLVLTVTYQHAGQKFSLKKVDLAQIGLGQEINARIKIASHRIEQAGSIVVYTDRPQDVKLVLPDEIVVTDKTIGPDRIIYQVKNARQGIAADYQIYAYLESVSDSGLNLVKLTSHKLATRVVVKAQSLFPRRVFLWIGLLSFLIALGGYIQGLKDSFTRRRITLVRSAFTVFTISFLLTLFHYSYLIADRLLPLLPEDVFGAGNVAAYFHQVLSTLVSVLYFDGDNYDSFAKYLADPLYFYVLFFNPFVIHFLICPEVYTDKYWHLIKFTFSFLPLKIVGTPRQHWSRLARLALLTLLVKVYYAPMLTSWLINGFYLQGQNLPEVLRMLAAPEYDFSRKLAEVNAYLITVLLLTDVFAFCFGYVTELPQLKNQIKSVEPTLLGWVVCIACYPPFNTFAFLPFDYALNAEWNEPFGGVLRNGVLILITCLWGVYCWASVSLGFRASNLTNRGIINKGPYGYIRHPAYASKMTIWTMESFFFGERAFFLILITLIIYTLRAWTEERHLKSDPDYLEYRKKVRWWFIPKIV